MEASPGAIVGLVFGRSSAADAKKALTAALRDDGAGSETPAGSELSLEPIVGRLKRFADGESIDLSDIPVELSHLTPFGRKIVAACRQLRWGETATYGGLAKRCGRPGAARAVGSVMAKNRVPLLIPCHRVVGAAGGLGGYSAPGGLDTKRRLLACEAS
ncbi:MAG: methylated-DNA--[protein]-cysteine S-methyltransferase [Planctomycetota bacterium]